MRERCSIRPVWIYLSLQKSDCFTHETISVLVRLPCLLKRKLHVIAILLQRAHDASTQSESHIRRRVVQKKSDDRATMFALEITKAWTEYYR